MKNKFIIFSFLLLLISTTAFCLRPVEEIKRVITKNFSVSANDELTITNKYGNIEIIEWNQKEVGITVEIIGKGEKREIAQDMIDRVSIDFNKTGRNISAETVFKNRNYSCNNCGTTVNYTVKVPVNVYLNLNNKYGNISLNRTERPFKCEIKYGDLTANQLAGKTNTIVIKYGNVNLTQTTELTLDMGYGNLVLDEANLLKFNSAYSKSKIGTLSKLELTSKYDKFTIKNLGELNMTTAYSDFNIDELQKSFIASSMKYCKLRISEVSLRFSDIDIEAAYTDIRIGITPQHNFKAKLYNNYGNIKTNGLKFSDVNFNEEKDRYAKSINGIAGSSSNPSASISITDKYADVILGN